MKPAATTRRICRSLRQRGLHPFNTSGTAFVDNVESGSKRTVLHAVQPLSLRRNFSWILAGNILYAGCQSAMLIVLAKLGSTQMVGEFALALAITTPPILFASALRGMQATDARNEYRFADYLVLQLLVLAVAAAIIVGAVFQANYHGEVGAVIAMVTLAKLFDSVSNGIYGLLQKQERMDKIALSRIIQGILQLLSLLLVVRATGSLLWGTLVMAVASALVTLCYDLPNARTALRLAAATELKLPFWQVKIATLKSLARLLLPLGFVLTLLSLNNNIPRYLIEHYRTTRELGVFAAIAYLMTAGMTIIGALGSSAMPRLSQYYAAGNVRAFRALFLKLIQISLALGGIGVAGALLAGRWILTVLYTAEYARFNMEFTWLMVACVFAYLASLMGYGMTAARFFAIQLPLNAVATGAAALTGLWLIPRYGLLGAAFSVVLTMAVHLLGGSAIMAYILRSPRRFPNRRMSVDRE